MKASNIGLVLIAITSSAACGGSIDISLTPHDDAGNVMDAGNSGDSGISVFPPNGTDASIFGDSANTADASNAADSVNMADVQVVTDTSQTDSVNSADTNNAADTVDSAGPVTSLEVDCSPQLTEPGRFSSNCQIIGSSDVIAECDHVPEPGFAGMIRIQVHKPQQIVIGTPTPVGGSDPVVSISAASYSVREGALVQTIDSQPPAGAIVFSRFEPGVALEGRFLGVTFPSYPMPPTIPCRLTDAPFLATSWILPDQ